MSDSNLIPPSHPLNQQKPEETTAKEERRSIRGVLSTIAIIITAPVVALILVTSVFQVYEVDGQSMEKALHNNDRLIVLKTPKTWAKVTGGHYIPERYDIVVFNQQGNFGGYTEERHLIKRVIGLPGDRVEVSGGKVMVYNAENPEGYLVDRDGPEYEYTKHTPGELKITVPDNEIFLLGDNRENSSDSRTFGTVSVDQIVGKLSLRFYPFDQAKKF